MKVFYYFSLTNNLDKVAEVLNKDNIEIRKVETIRKFPKKMLIFYIMLYLTPFLSSIGWLIEMKIYGPDIARVLTHPFFLVMEGVYIVFIVWNYIYHTRKLYS